MQNQKKSPQSKLWITKGKLEGKKKEKRVDQKKKKKNTQREKQIPRLRAAQMVQNVTFSGNAEKQSVGVRSPRRFLCLDIELCVKSWGV